MPNQYKVPQNIDLEDKIVGPFTMKQFGYLMGGGVLVYAIYQMFLPYVNGLLYTILLALPVAMLTVALTFIKINDRPFEYFVINLFGYIFAPKKRVWQQNYSAPAVVIKTPVKQKASTTNHTAKRATLDEIATTLDLAAGNTGPEKQAGQQAAQPQNGQQQPAVQGVESLTLMNQGQEQAAQPQQAQAQQPAPQAKPKGILSRIFSS